MVSLIEKYQIRTKFRTDHNILKFSFTNAPNRHISRFDDNGDRLSRRSKNTEVDSMHTTPTCSTASSPKGSSSCSESIQTDSPSITKSNRPKLPGPISKKQSGSGTGIAIGIGPTGMKPEVKKPEVKKLESLKRELTKAKSKKSGSKKLPKSISRLSVGGSAVSEFQFDLDPIPLKPRSSSNTQSTWFTDGFAWMARPPIHVNHLSTLCYQALKLTNKNRLNSEKFQNFHFKSHNCHFWGKITKTITRMNFQILINSFFIWFFKFFIIGMTIFRKKVKFIYRLNLLKSGNSS